MGRKTPNICHVLWYIFLFLATSIMTQSASFKISRRGFVISPMTLTARPGPGKGWRPVISFARPSSEPTLRTSSLKRSLKGSTSLSPIFRGSPPTLWCDLIVLEGPPKKVCDSITSGYSVPWARKFAFFIFFAASSNTRIKVFPIILRFFSGSVTPLSASRNLFSASITFRSSLMFFLKSLSTLSRSPLRKRPLSTKMQ